MKHTNYSYFKVIYAFILSLVVFSIGSGAYAQNSDVSYISTFFVTLMSWAWTIPAIVAGELMSNDLIYGQIVGLEHYFYQFWTLMRTIANFALVAIIVMIISKVMTNGTKAGEVLSKYGVKLLISGVLINMSWFLMGAMVDISTIAIAGVGQIGSQFMTSTYKSSSEPNDRVRAESLVKGIPDKIMVDKKGCITNTVDGKNSDKNWVNLISNKSSITGPLIFLGAGLMKIQAFSQNIGCESNVFGDVGKITLKLWISSLMIIMFVLPLIILATFNLFRLLYIRGRIICSPLIVLVNLFEEEAKLIGLDSMKKYVSWNTIITGLFQPVFTVGVLVIGMMFVTGVYKAVDFTQTNGLESHIEGLRNKNSASSISFGEDGSSISMIDVVIDDPTGTIGGGFGYIVMSLAVCFVLWMLVKFSFEFSKEGIGQTFDAQNLMSTFFDKFSKKVKMPDLGFGTPLEGASLAETMKFMHPETNHILKTIEKYGKDRADADYQKAARYMESGISWLQKTGDLTSSDEDKIKIVEYEKNQADWVVKTKEMFDIIRESARNSEKSDFKANTPRRKTYNVLKNWYEKGGYKALNELKITDPTDNKKVLEFKKDDFDKEISKTGVLGGFIKKLYNSKNIEWKDGLHVDNNKFNGNELTDAKNQAQGTNINFK